MSYILAIGTGLIVGVIFALVKLPIPAPNDIRGVLGILGIFLGYLLVRAVVK